MHKRIFNSLVLCTIAVTSGVPLSYAAAQRGAVANDCREYTTECGVLRWNEDAQMCLLHEGDTAQCETGTRDEIGSPLPVWVGWDTGGRADTSPVRRVLSAVLRNRTQETMQVELAVTAIGLDQRGVRRVLKQRLRLRPGAEKRVRVPLRLIPVQGVGSLTSVELDATFPWDEGSTLASPSEPIWLDFTADYRGATIHAFDTAVKKFDTASLRSIETFKAAWTAAFAGPVDPPGRVYDAAKRRMVEVGILRETERGQSETYPGAGGIGFGTGTNGDLIEEYLDLLPVVLPTDAKSFRLCSHWPAAYVDAGRGEDYLAEKGLQQVPAYYAEFDVLRPDMTKVIEGGYFDEHGCAVVQLPEGSYQLVQRPHFKDPAGNEARIVVRDPIENAIGGYFLTANLNVALIPGFPSVLPHNIYPAAHDHATRIAAVVGQVLITPDNGLRQGDNCFVSSERLYLIADADCGNSSACADPCGMIFLGGPLPNEDPTATHSSREKFTIAHEIGHAQQGQLMGIWQHDYALSISGHPLCTCDHVSSSNSIHCMQSLEWNNGASVEGWAHFFAAKVFNDPDDDDCKFLYYKEFLRVGGSIAHPPVQIDCHTPKQWMRTHCNVATYSYDVGTEMDWMHFLWNVYAVGEHTATMDDLDAIFRAACLTSPQPCWYEETPEYPMGISPPMAAVLYMAAIHFGADDPRNAHFIQAAVASGLFNP